MRVFSSAGVFSFVDVSGAGPHVELDGIYGGFEDFVAEAVITGGWIPVFGDLFLGALSLLNSRFLAVMNKRWGVGFRMEADPHALLRFSPGCDGLRWFP